uniref:Uncharacterized protein n=1 Tax=Sander lucioperca TaxID=283035 RepID=A0A8C9X073_SANLU
MLASSNEAFKSLASSLCSWCYFDWTGEFLKSLKYLCNPCQLYVNQQLLIVDTLKALFGESCFSQPDDVFNKLS